MEIQYSKQALKFLQKQDRITQQRLVNAINRLPDGDVRKLKNRRGYRLRVGNFRILFDREGNVICIQEVDNRGQIYK